MAADNTPVLPRLLATLVAIALTGAVVSLVLSGTVQPPRAVTLHLVFAVGIMPLIFGAMTWFIPPLSRSGPPEASALWPPLLALAAGCLLIPGLAGYYPLLPLAALLALAACLQISWWSRRRSAVALGGPHPGLLWYRMALGFLGLGLLAILLGTVWPEQWPALRRLHLHLNLLGFVGLTAIGTWRVLLPTVAGFPDPEANHWLRRQWRFLVPGTLLIGIGAAWSRNLAMAGLLLCLIPLLGLLITPLYRHRRLVWRLHGAAPPLAFAFIGLLTVLLAGGLHGFVPSFSGHLSEAFTLAFLMPLVTGAAGHLLPFWLRPQAGYAAQLEMRNRLGHFSAVRALVFIIAGGLLLAGWEQAWLPALAALLHFLLAVLRSLGRPREAA